MSIDKETIKDIQLLTVFKRLKDYIDSHEYAKGEKGDKGDKGDRGERGFSGLNGKDGRDGRDGKDGKDGKDGRDGNDGSIKELSPDEIRNSLELLQGDERLDKSAIKGLEEIEKTIETKIETAKEVRVVGGLSGIYLFIDGKKYGLNKNINFIAGDGITLAYNKSGNRTDITISNSSVSGTILTATGTIDDDNKDFTFTSKPSIIVINGASYRETGGAITWTWDTLTATLSVPVGVGGDIYGIR
jgi:hypothetical protein